MSIHAQMKNMSVDNLQELGWSCQVFIKHELFLHSLNLMTNDTLCHIIDSKICINLEPYADM